MAEASLTTALEPLDGSDPALVAAWAALADALEASPFLHPGWVLAWWKAFGVPAGIGHGAELLLATVHRGDELAAALPLVRGGGVVASPANWHTPHAGPLARDGEAAEALAAAVFATRMRRLRLVFLDRGSADELAAPARRDGFRVLERTLMHSPYLDVDGDWEAFEATMSSRRRSELRRMRRRLGERGEVVLELTDGGERTDELLDELMRIEALSWKGQAGTAIAQEQDTARFYRAVAHWAAERGWLRFHVLRLDGTAIASSLALCAHGVHYGVKMGYDPQYAKLAPGRMLLDEIMRGAFAEGLRRVELLGDQTPYKREWSETTHERLALRAFARSPRGSAEYVVFRYGRPLARRAAARLRLRRKRSER